MEKEQIEMKVIPPHAHALLPGNKGEAGAEFQQDAFDLAEDGA
jgi:hypothetical protein